MSLASKDELAAWRSHPVTVALLAWLDERIAVHRRDVPVFVAKNRIEDARAAAGSLMGYEEVRDAVTEDPILIADEPEEPFNDPATRPSLRSDHAA